MMEDDAKVDSFEWLYPETLSSEGLISLLKQRYIKHVRKDLAQLDKEELVELYNRYVLPLPQRKYRNNRRGQEMSKKQILIERTLNRQQSDSSSGPSPLKAQRQDGASSGLVNYSSSSGSSGTRLKPPPSVVSSEKKVVKLNSGKVMSSPKMDNIIIKSVSKSESNGESLQNGLALGNGKQPEKRSHSSLLDEGQDKVPQETDCSQAKKKVTKITWP